jgi:tetratricopeptide (TPR) repeat protein
VSRIVQWTVLLAIAAAVGCGKSASVPQAAPPPPAPVPVAVPDPIPSTIEESIAAKGRGRTDLFEAGLQRLGDSTDEAVRRRALALLGLFQLDQKRWAESIETLGKAVHAYPDVAPFLELRIIEAQRQLGRTAEAIASSQDLIARAPSSGAAISARIALPALSAATGDRTGVERAAAALGAVPIDELTESEMVAAADQLARFGYADLATPVRMRVLTTYPQGRYTE